MLLLYGGTPPIIYLASKFYLFMNMFTMTSLSVDVIIDLFSFPVQTNRNHYKFAGDVITALTK